HPPRPGGNVHYDLWATVFASSMLTGVSLVVLLTAKRAKEPLAMLAGLTSMGVNAWAVAHLLTEYGRFETALYAGILGAAAAAGGYGLASSLLPMHLATEPVLDPIGEFDAVADSPIAVLLACPLEPEHYTPSAVAADLSEMTAAGLPEAGMAIMPFLYAAQKARYRAAGGRSPSIRQATALAEHLEETLDSAEFRPIELVTCTGDDTLDTAVARAAQRGCDRIVVVTLSIGESYQIDRAKSRVDLLRPQRAGIRVAYTPPLWGSESLAEDLAKRIWVGRDAPDKTGVALVLHGQPEARLAGA
ncbi:MAG: ferrochelatase, partial [Desulfobacterales bacterium]|nr:ferrochelatase [Desulfobacterales bacterium]